jgi:acyl carrier protein
MAETTSARVREIICEHLGIDTEKIMDDTRMSALGADSLDRIEIAMAIEDEFDIKIADDVLDANVTSDSTISTLTAFVDKMMAR